MSAADSRQFRADLGAIVGTDIVNVTAGDKERHFDPITFLHIYAGTLFLLFAKGIVEGAGKKAGELMMGKIADKLKALTDLKVAGEDEQQLQEMQKADDALSSLGHELEASHLDDFLSAGKQAIEQRLIRDNFPKRKAALISGQFMEKVKQRMAA